MLDNEKKIVCKALMELCGSDGMFKVVEAEEIMERMPDVYMTKVELSSIIRDLKERNYIKVKYFTPDEYCIQVLPIIEKEFEAPKSDLPPILAMEKGEAPEVEEAPTNNDVVSEATLVSETKKETPVVSKGLTKKVFLLALLGSFLGGAIVTAIAIIIQKFVF